MASILVFIGAKDKDHKDPGIFKVLKIWNLRVVAC
jgi:hypothetical protein